VSDQNRAPLRPEEDDLPLMARRILEGYDEDERYAAAERARASKGLPSRPRVGAAGAGAKVPLVRGAGAFSTDPAIRAAAQQYVDNTEASIEKARAGDDFAAEARAAVAKVDPRKDWNLPKKAPAGAAIPLTSGGKPKVPRRSVSDATAALAAATSRDEARAALAGLTVVELRGVAAGMRDGQGITVRDGKDNMINDIVEVAVGRRLDSEAIGRQGAGRRPGGIVTGPNARQQAAIELGTSFSGNPYMKLPKLEALTDEDFRGLTPDQQDNVRFLIHKLTQRAPGEDQRRAEALRARFGAWSSGKA
jgi:hypothetical protein